MGHSTLSIESASSWARQLLDEGMVLAGFNERRDAIARQLAEHSAALGTTIGDAPETRALLDEVTALVEYPTVYAGAFDQTFLDVPPECLILTMRLNRSEEHTSELQSLMRISYAVFCLKKKKTNKYNIQ